MLQRRRGFRRLHADLSLIHHYVVCAANEPTGLTTLELLTIALEDRRFFRHIGVDVPSIVREVVKALTFRRHGGASTIDMQFVRTVTGYRDRTIGRKLYEAFLAIALQRRYSKREILRSYLACAFFGSGLFGANAAAQKMFGKRPEELTLDEASLLAAMLARPRPIRGSPNWELRVRRRAAYGLDVYRSRAWNFSSRSSPIWSIDFNPPHRKLT